MQHSKVHAHTNAHADAQIFAQTHARTINRTNTHMHEHFEPFTPVHNHKRAQIVEMHLYVMAGEWS